MHIEKISITKENMFGDRYTIERDQLVYDDEAERQKGMAYNENYSLLLTQHHIVIWNSHVLKCSYFLLHSYVK